MSQLASNSNCLRSTSRRILAVLSKKGCLTSSQLKQIQSQLIVCSPISDLCRSHSVWNTVLRALAETHQPENALSLCRQMVRYNLLPDNYTLSFVYRSCSEIRNVFCVSMYHAFVIKLGWDFNDYVRNGLIHCYASCGFPEFARKVFDTSDERDIITWTAVINGYLKVGEMNFAMELFDKMPEKNAASWSAMINGCTRMGLFAEAMEMFKDMLVAGIRPNHSGLVGALSACASLGALAQGRWLHAYIDSNDMEVDGVLGTAIVDMYAKCGCIDNSLNVFERMSYRDVFAYTALISGLADHGKGTTALELFSRMVVEGVKPNEVTFICVLSACSRIGAVIEGLTIFRSMKDVYGITPGPKHYGCLVDLLGRAGLLKQAESVIRRMPVEPDPYVLGALLSACRAYGNVDLAKLMVDAFTNRCIDHSGVHVLLSNIYAALNKWDDVEKVRKGMGEKQVKKVTGCSLVEVDGWVSEFVAEDRFNLHMDETVNISVTMEKHSKSLHIEDGCDFKQV